jgi:hypothetical protein
VKWLAFLLLAANLAYFTWEFNRALYEPAVRPPAPLPEGVAKLKLLHELDALPAAREAPALPDTEASAAVGEPGDATTPDAGVRDATGIAPEDGHEVIYYDAGGAPTMQPPDLEAAVCFEFGPLASATEADSLEQWLSGRSLWTRERSEDGERRRLFWVYLDPVQSDEIARRRVADLARKGVSDYLLISKGGLKNAISLGVFSSQESVNRRLAELTEQGYQPVVVPRYESEKRFWVGFGLADEGDMDEVIAGLPLAANGRQRPCDEIAIARLPD